MAEIHEAVIWRAPGPRDEVEDLLRRVEELRSDIGTDVWELERRVRSAFDIRLQLARHPLGVATVVLGVAAGTVAVVKLLFAVRRKNRRSSRP